MAGRHRTHGKARTPARGPWLIVGAALAAVAVGVIGIALVAGRSSPTSPGTDAAGTAPVQADGCPQRVVVPVAASPAIASAVEAVTASEAATEALGPCVVVPVTARDSLLLATQPVTATSPALWVADASMWGEQLNQRLGSEVATNLGSVATSPLVLAATPQAARQLVGSSESPAEVLWSQVLTGTTTLGVVDPETSTEGMATLSTLEAVLGGTPGQPPPESLVRSFVGLSRAVLPSVQDGFALAAADATAPVFATTEQSVLAAAASGSDIVSIYPSQGTATFDYPVLRLVRPGETEQIDSAVRAVARVLLSQEAAEAVREAGFRPPTGTPGATPSPPPGVPSPPPPDVALTYALAQDALRTWSAVTLEARMLTVIDVSGSMAEDAGNGRTRIELARDAALAALRLYPDSAQIGLWAFSVLQNPPDDWVELVGLGALSDPQGGGTRRDLLGSQAQTLPTRVLGGTGLYDTALAAFRTVRAGYDPARVNSVVLLTDGRNEDDAVGIDLDTLLRTLRTEFDPAQPVPIITIGMGPDADLETLRLIAETTGGKAYQALDPNDIETVFLDAMVERRCRPSC